MATVFSATGSTIIYPSSDGEPLAETSVHIDAIIAIVVALRLYLKDHPCRSVFVLRSGLP
jgi:hypothetical protein